MNGLRTVLTPFAPDQSGAVSVLYEMGGLTVILDAGGCTGNICGFDEPRWFIKRSAIMSAGLRDMDAILGRDKLLVRKVKDAVSKLHPKFVAIIGTPVPAVIGTDMKGLVRLVKNEIPEDIDVLAVETYGFKLYDTGISKAYKSLIETFVSDKQSTDDGKIGLWGATPLDLNETDSGDLKTLFAQKEGDKEIVCYGLGNGIEDLRSAANVSKNIAVSVAGLEACRILNEKYDIPYEIYNPVGDFYGDLAIKEWNDDKKHKVLVVSEQVLGNSIREYLKDRGDVTVASFFMMDSEITKECDSCLREEDDFINLIRANGYDTIICDPILKDLLSAKDLKEITTIDLVHFAISGSFESRKILADRLES